MKKSKLSAKKQSRKQEPKFDPMFEEEDFNPVDVGLGHENAQPISQPAPATEPAVTSIEEAPISPHPPAPEPAPPVIEVQTDPKALKKKVGYYLSSATYADFEKIFLDLRLKGWQLDKSYFVDVLLQFGLEDIRKGKNSRVLKKLQPRY